MEKVKLKRQTERVFDVAVETAGADLPIGYCVRASWGDVWFAYSPTGRTVAGRGGVGAHSSLHYAARAILQKNAADAMAAMCLLELQGLRHA